MTIPLNAQLHGLEIKTWLKLLAFAFFVSIVSKGAALFDFGYTVDTYAGFSSSGASYFIQELSQGRFTGAVLLWVFQLFGISGAYPYIVGTILGYIAIGIMAVVLCKPFSTVDNHIALPVLLGIGIAISNPYLSEIFTFRGAALIHFSVATILGISGYLIVDKSTKRIIYGAILIALGLGIYQIFLNYLAVALAFSLLVSLRNDKEETRRSEMLGLDLKRFLAIILGVLIYFIILKAIALLAGVSPDARTQFIALEDCPQRVIEIVKSIWGVFNDKKLSGAYYPLWFSVILFCAMLSIIKQRKIAIILLSFLILLGALFSIVGVLAVNKDYWAVPRTLSGSAFFIAGCVAYAIHFSSKRIRCFVIIISVLAAIGYAAISNKIFVDQQRVNIRDRALATRMVMRLEALPQFKEIHRIAIVGLKWGYSFGYDTVWGDLNISAFGATWSNLNLLREVSGYDFVPVTPSDMDVARMYCSNHANWPAIDSVSQMGDLGIICLESNK